MPNRFLQLSFQFDSFNFFFSNRALPLLTRTILYLLTWANDAMDEIQLLNETDAFKQILKKFRQHIEHHKNKNNKETFETFIWCPMCDPIQIDKHKLIPQKNKKKNEKLQCFVFFFLNKNESDHLNISARPNRFMTMPSLRLLSNFFHNPKSKIHLLKTFKMFISNWTAFGVLRLIKSIDKYLFTSKWSDAWTL